MDFTNVNPFVAIVGVVMFIAQTTLTARRLHDTNRSAAWLLIGLLPVIGWIVLLIMLCQPTNVSKNKNYAAQLNQSSQDAVHY